MRFFLLIFLLLSASCSQKVHKTVRVGMDPIWYPIDFGPQTSYVNGFTENLLIAMAQYSGLQFELTDANWDDLVDRLDQGQYDAILTSMPPYEYNRAKYSFSKTYLMTGPVVILPYDAKETSLDKMHDALVGIISNDPVENFLEKYPNLILRSYQSIPFLLDSVAKGEIQGAVLNFIPAVSYVSDIYAGVLKIAGEPLTEEGLRLVGKPSAVEAFDRNLKSLKKKSSYKKLLKKWSLYRP